MIKLIMLITIWLVVGCGTDDLIDNPTPKYFIDPTLATHLGNFRNEATLHNRDILVEVQVYKFVPKGYKNKHGNLGDKASAKCIYADESETWVPDVDGAEDSVSYTRDFKWREIWIRDDMRDIPERALERLFYHEMGHCALNLKHADSTDAIMYKNTPIEDDLDDDTWAFMVDEFFETTTD